MGEQEELLLGGFGVSGLWGNEKDVWYPLLPDSHSFFEEENIPVDNPHALLFSTFPQQILVRAKPDIGGLNSSTSIEQRIFEVSK